MRGHAVPELISRSVEEENAKTLRRKDAKLSYEPPTLNKTEPTQFKPVKTSPRRIRLIDLCVSAPSRLCVETTKNLLTKNELGRQRTQRREVFFQSDRRSKSVEQLSQLFTAGHSNGLERKHLGQMFYNKSFTALQRTGRHHPLFSLVPSSEVH